MSEGVRSTHVRALLRGLDAVGLRAVELQRAVGVGDEVLADPDQFVPAATVHALWERAVACDPSPDLGLRVGAAVPAGAFDVYDYLMPACATLGDAMHAIARLHRVATTISRFVVAPLDERTVRVESVLLVPGVHPPPGARLRLQRAGAPPPPHRPLHGSGRHRAARPRPGVARAL